MANRVLVIDDSEQVQTLIRDHLRDECVQIITARDGSAGLEIARRQKPDLILLDADKPAPDGLELCRQLKSDPETNNIPLIFLSVAADTAQKMEGLDSGAIDYLIKPFDAAELCARVRTGLRLRYLMELLVQKAQVDGLTGLWNRAYLDDRLEAQLALATRHNLPLSVVMIDLDHFKKINDACGHPFGDIVLRAVAALLTAVTRKEDVVCRYGGEEFAAILPQTKAAGACELAERIRVMVTRLGLTHCGQPVPVTCSFGVADLACAGLQTLTEAADEAVYVAKCNGRNRIEIAGAKPKAQAAA